MYRCHNDVDLFMFTKSKRTVTKIICNRNFDKNQPLSIESSFEISMNFNLKLDSIWIDFIWKFLGNELPIQKQKLSIFLTKEENKDSDCQMALVIIWQLVHWSIGISLCAAVIFVLFIWNWNCIGNFFRSQKTIRL